MVNAADISHCNDNHSHICVWSVQGVSHSNSLVCGGEYNTIFMVNNGEEKREQSRLL